MAVALVHQVLKQCRCKPNVWVRFPFWTLFDSVEKTNSFNNITSHTKPFYCLEEISSLRVLCYLNFKYKVKVDPQCRLIFLWNVSGVIGMTEFFVTKCILIFRKSIQTKTFSHIGKTGREFCFSNDLKKNVFKSQIQIFSGFFFLNPDKFMDCLC